MLNIRTLNQITVFLESLKVLLVKSLMRWDVRSLGIFSIKRRHRKLLSRNLLHSDQLKHQKVLATKSCMRY